MAATQKHNIEKLLNTLEGVKLLVEVRSDELRSACAPGRKLDVCIPTGSVGLESYSAKMGSALLDATEAFVKDIQKARLRLESVLHLQYDLEEKVGETKHDD